MPLDRVNPVNIDRLLGTVISVPHSSRPRPSLHRQLQPWHPLAECTGGICQVLLVV